MKICNKIEKKKCGESANRRNGGTLHSNLNWIMIVYECHMVAQLHQFKIWELDSYNQKIPWAEFSTLNKLHFLFAGDINHIARKALKIL